MISKAGGFASYVHDRFGPAGVVAVLALVLALGGGAAVAAKKGKRGPAGPPGPAGPAGPQGPAGQVGTAGANGTDGGDGVSVTSAPESTGTANCSGRGGSKFTSASGVTYACNGVRGADGNDGVPGEPWTAGGTLPPGEGVKGAWSIAPAADSGLAFGAVSFSIPLPTELPGTPVIPTANVHVLDFTGAAPTIPDECQNPDDPGTFHQEEPEADPGHACIAVAASGEAGLPSSISANSPIQPGGGSVGGISSTGFVLAGEVASSAGFAYGTWAVTAPN